MKCSGWKNVSKIQIYSKIFANFCVCVLTHNILYILFLVFLPIFWTNSWKFFLRLSVCCWLKCGSPRLDLFSCKFSFVDFVNFCRKCVKHSNAHVRRMHLFSEQLSKAAVWKWRIQSTVNVSSGLSKRIILMINKNSFMNEL